MLLVAPSTKTGYHHRLRSVANWANFMDVLKFVNHFNLEFSLILLYKRKGYTSEKDFCQYSLSLSLSLLINDSIDRREREKRRE